MEYNPQIEIAIAAGLGLILAVFSGATVYRNVSEKAKEALEANDSYKDLALTMLPILDLVWKRVGVESFPLPKILNSISQVLGYEIPDNEAMNAVQGMVDTYFKPSVFATKSKTEVNPKVDEVIAKLNQPNG